MYFVALLSTLVVVATAIPAPEVFNCRTPCPRHYMPVCGSNGRTYANDCTFRNAQCLDEELRLLRAGSCDGPRRTKPLPPNRDDNYPEAEAEEDADTSHLTPPPCLRPCARLFDPVCGTNGHTYSSQCELENAACRHPQNHIVLGSRGQCPSRSSIFDSYNQARAEAEAEAEVEESRVTDRHHGNREREPCFSFCTRQYAPVCASNNVTYGNRCMFQAANCRSGGTLSVLQRGRCIE